MVASLSHLIGPLKVCADDAEKVFEYFDCLPETEKEKMHCFSLFSNCIDKIDIYPVFIDARDWIEIDTPQDIEIASKKLN